MSIKDLTVSLNLEKEDGSISKLVINPKTNDNLLHYLVLLIISLCGLIFIKKKIKIKNIKVGYLLILLSIILIPFSTLANEDFKVNIIFSDIQIKGEFEIFNIVIDPKDGSDVIIKNIKYGDAVGDLPNPNKQGYDFVKWVDSTGKEVTKDTIITKQIEVEAIYKIKEYSISYNLNGGSLEDGKTNPDKYTIESDDITLNNPSKNGYTFIGWTGSNGDTPQINVTILKGSNGIKKLCSKLFG